MFQDIFHLLFESNQHSEFVCFGQPTIILPSLFFILLLFLLYNNWMCISDTSLTLFILVVLSFLQRLFSLYFNLYCRCTCHIKKSPSYPHGQDGNIVYFRHFVISVYIVCIFVFGTLIIPIKNPHPMHHAQDGNIA